MLRELQVIEADLSDFMDQEEMRLTHAQWAQLDRILVKIQHLEDEIKNRRKDSK